MTPNVSNCNTTNMLPLDNLYCENIDPQALIAQPWMFASTLLFHVVYPLVVLLFAIGLSFAGGWSYYRGLLLWLVFGVARTVYFALGGTEASHGVPLFAWVVVVWSLLFAHLANIHVRALWPNSRKNTSVGHILALFVVIFWYTTLLGGADTETRRKIATMLNGWIETKWLHLWDFMVFVAGLVPVLVLYLYAWAFGSNRKNGMDYVYSLILGALVCLFFFLPSNICGSPGAYLFAFFGNILLNPLLQLVLCLSVARKLPDMREVMVAKYFGTRGSMLFIPLIWMVSEGKTGYSKVASQQEEGVPVGIVVRGPQVPNYNGAF